MEIEKHVSKHYKSFEKTQKLFKNSYTHQIKLVVNTSKNCLRSRGSIESNS